MLTLAEKSKILNQCELFSNMPAKSIRQIATAVENVTYNAGDVIIREGDSGDALYAVVEGEVRLIKEDVHVLTLGAGAVIGEMALLDGEPRSATLVADTYVVALRLTRAEFQPVLRRDPDIMEGMNTLLTNKLRYDLSVHVDTVRRQEQLNQDIKRAREVQQAMLPQEDLLDLSVNITGYCKPAASVGGDYYDYFKVSDDSIALFIGDVTGHGFYSGLLVAIAKSCLVTQVEIDPSVESVMHAVNRAIHPIGADWMFMTVCFALLNTTERTLVYGNSGHNPPYHYRKESGELTELASTDPPLGIFDHTTCDPVAISWQPGDTLVFYSDGVVEAENEVGALLGEARFESCILAAIDGSATDIKQAILQDIEAFTSGTAQMDDVTLMVVRL